MIVWLASWPRCGNTLLRLILQQCFEIETYSVYPEEEVEWLFGNSAYTFGKEWSREKYEEIASSDKTYFIKTHVTPVDSFPVIYIARDGRDACVSLSHFWEIPLEKIIKNDYEAYALRLKFSWSEHYEKWKENIKKNGVCLLFEQMIREPACIEFLLSLYLEREPTKSFVNNFSEYHKNNSQMFRKGKVGTWRDEFSKENEDIFWKLHGDTMEALGYSQ